MYDRIDYFGAGVYVIYDADGYAFRAVKRPGDSFWLARPSHMTKALDTRSFTARTLGELGRKVGASSRKGIGNA